jgi:20S proteasome alpha/beta subunit
MLALKPHCELRPKSRRFPIGKLMTIAAGFYCTDGLVLCADTQETIVGYSKVNTQKMTQVSTEFYNVVFTGAGDSGLIDMTVQLMDQALTSRKPSAGWEIEKVLRDSLIGTFNAHIAPWSQFPAEDRPAVPDLLIGLQFPTAALLYRASGTTFRSVRESQCVGTGVVLANSLIAKLFDYQMSIAQGWLIALYILHQAKTWVDGCGGNSDILLLSNSDRKITRIPTADVTQMEQHFADFDVYLRPVLLSVADRKMSQKQVDDRINEFRLGMLTLRGKFMEFEEFARHLYTLTGIPITDDVITPQGPSESNSSQSSKT